MILKVKEFQNACKSILAAVDTTSKTIENETLELVAENKVLTLCVTNKEYFVSVRMNVDFDESFIATVDAKLFLSLIAKITTTEVDLSIKGNTLVIKGNGQYKLPMIYEDTKLLELKPIIIENKTSTFVMSSDNLLSILAFNSKELLKGTIKRPVQAMYYMDNEGCITFTDGACVNSFTLEQPIKVLLTQKLVKLFNLFNKNTDVQFTLGYDSVGSIIQPKVSFENDSISITAILPSDPNYLTSVPVRAIRARANNMYKYTVNVSKDDLVQAIDRLLLFADTKTAKTKAKIEFNVDSMIMYGPDGETMEVINYVNTSIDEPYTASLDLTSLKLTLDTCVEQYLTIHFGDNQAMVISRGSIKNVIPQLA